MSNYSSSTRALLTTLEVSSFPWAISVVLGEENTLGAGWELAIASHSTSSFTSKGLPHMRCDQYLGLNCPQVPAEHGPPQTSMDQLKGFPLPAFSQSQPCCPQPVRRLLAFRCFPPLLPPPYLLTPQAVTLRGQSTLFQYLQLSAPLPW